MSILQNKTMRAAALALALTGVAGGTIIASIEPAQADDRRWHVTDIVFHVLALAWGLVALVLLVPFVLALGRAVVMRPGLRPGVIGAVEVVVSVSVVVAVLVVVN